MPEEYWAAHHRKLRSHGRDDSLTNLVALHHMCHNLATDSVHLSPGPAYERGLMVRSWEDPAQVPLILRDGVAVLLGATYKEITDDPSGTHREEAPGS
jgi:hypothetical protein